MADSAFSAIRRGGYTNVDNDIFKHGLSARAIGVLALMLSKPATWRFASERLADEVAEGREAVRTALRELEAVGFVKRRKVGGLRPQTIVYVRDSLLAEWPWEEPQVAPTAQESVVGNSGVGNLGPLATTEEVTTRTHPHQRPADGRRIDLWFDAFWELYPRRVDKKAARAAFIKVWDAGHYSPMMAGLEARTLWWKLSETPRDKIPHPTTWLNRERWNDEIEPVVVKPSARASTQERFAQAAEMTENIGPESIFDQMKRGGQPQQTAIGA